eukprot:3933642-Rhodomonas_salina.1
MAVLLSEPKDKLDQGVHIDATPQTIFPSIHRRIQPISYLIPEVSAPLASVALHFVVWFDE